MARGNYHNNNGHVPQEFYDPEWLRNAYLNEKLASNTIANMLGVSKKNVLLQLRKFGIPRRTASESKSTPEYLSRMSGKNHPLYNPVGGYVTAKRRGYGNKFGCVVCGWKDATNDIHHKVHKRDGGKDTMENLTILCPNHHRMAHRGKLDTSSLPSIDELVNGAVVGTQS